jgi:cytidine deaminase
VGAAGIDAEGRIFVGCNVENVVYMVIHGEWVMVGNATLADTKLIAMICVCGPKNLVRTPCLFCRQVLGEHGGPEMLIYTSRGPERLGDLDKDVFDFELFEEAVDKS